jgi:hypothetical protein
MIAAANCRAPRHHPAGRLPRHGFFRGNQDWRRVLGYPAAGRAGRCTASQSTDFRLIRRHRRTHHLQHPPNPIIAATAAFNKRRALDWLPIIARAPRLRLWHIRKRRIILTVVAAHLVNHQVAATFLSEKPTFQLH